jgi:hypothetical protein
MLIVLIAIARMTVVVVDSADVMRMTVAGAVVDLADVMRMTVAVVDLADVTKTTVVAVDLADVMTTTDVVAETTTIDGVVGTTVVAMEINMIGNSRHQNVLLLIC